MKDNILVAFSGGRTSAFMCWWLKIHMAHLYNFKFTYANTGLEHEKTLEFVDKVDKFLQLELTWLEAVINTEQGKGTTYKVVDFNTATRDGALIYWGLCEAYGLPNKDFPHWHKRIKKYSDEQICKRFFR